MNEEQDHEVTQLIDGIGKLLDGKDNAVAIHALMTSLVIMILMGAPPDKRNKALVFIVKNMRDMVRDGTNAERMRMQ